LISEIALTADHLIVIGRGRLIADVSVEELTARASRDVVAVRTPDAGRLGALLAGPEVAVRASERDLVEVEGVGAPEIGELARDHGLALHELTPRRASLEEAFIELTSDAVEYRAGLEETTA
jgi:ABC-2 type transport system ATP-binding protein